MHILVPGTAPRSGGCRCKRGRRSTATFTLRIVWSSRRDRVAEPQPLGAQLQAGRRPRRMACSAAAAAVTPRAQPQHGQLRASQCDDVARILRRVSGAKLALLLGVQSPAVSLAFCPPSLPQYLAPRTVASASASSSASASLAMGEPMGNDSVMLANLAPAEHHAHAS